MFLKRRIVIILFSLAALAAFFALSVFIYYQSGKLGIPVSADGSEPIIIIDAGHGGFDGGAVADDGTVEKDLNLQIALKLNDILRMAGYKTILTRTDDTPTSDPDAKTIREKKHTDLVNRMKLIEETPNAYFVSIHQNMFGVSSYWGSQVFYSGNNPESEILAKNVQQSIRELLQPNNKREIKKSGKSIYLLYYAEKPAILIECGFMSNGPELAKLKNEDYQKKLAFAIFCGINEYFNSP